MGEYLQHCKTLWVPHCIRKEVYKLRPFTIYIIFSHYTKMKLKSLGYERCRLAPVMSFALWSCNIDFHIHTAGWPMASQGHLSIMTFSYGITSLIIIELMRKKVHLNIQHNKYYLLCQNSSLGLTGTIRHGDSILTWWSLKWQFPYFIGGSRFDVKIPI